VPSRRLTLASILVGIGLAGVVDEIVFHQLLHWHHLYDRSTRSAGLSSDGVLSIACNALLFVGLLLLWRLRADGIARFRQTISGGIMIGIGGFNLFDGTVDHKLLRIHQIREDVKHLLPYDITWISLSALVLAGGFVLWRRADAERHVDARPAVFR
jgi:uncharacterized membrane protein